MTTATATMESILTCPQCGHATVEEMSLDSCRFFHECPRCHTVLRPKAGLLCFLLLWLHKVPADTVAGSLLQRLTTWKLRVV